MYFILNNFHVSVYRLYAIYISIFELCWNELPTATLLPVILLVIPKTSTLDAKYF